MPFKPDFSDLPLVRQLSLARWERTSVCFFTTSTQCYSLCWSFEHKHNKNRSWSVEAPVPFFFPQEAWLHLWLKALLMLQSEIGRLRAANGLKSQPGCSFLTIHPSPSSPSSMHTPPPNLASSVKHIVRTHAHIHTERLRERGWSHKTTLLIFFWKEFLDLILA